MVLRLYYDLMSQPSRTLYILLNTAKCNFESKPVDLRKGNKLTVKMIKVYSINKYWNIQRTSYYINYK